jgi:chromosome segregation ATPase
MDNLTLDESSNVSLIKTKFESIKTQMNKISKGINSLKNLIPDEDLANLIKLSTLSEGISKKYKRANSKFMNAITNAQKNIDEQLSVNSDISTLDKSSEASMSNIMALKKDLQTQNPLINKDRIERLKRVKKEYQQIYDISSSLNQLSEDIKFNTLNQDKQIEIISANINGIDENINKGNEELKKYKEENMVDNTVYYKYIGIIILVIMLFALLIYYKLNLASSGEVSVSSQIEETFFMKNSTK